jgi:hypothetical protein
MHIHAHSIYIHIHTSLVRGMCLLEHGLLASLNVLRGQLHVACGRNILGQLQSGKIGRVKGLICSKYCSFTHIMCVCICTYEAAHSYIIQNFTSHADATYSGNCNKGKAIHAHKNAYVYVYIYLVKIEVSVCV